MEKTTDLPKSLKPHQALLSRRETHEDFIFQKPFTDSLASRARQGIATTIPAFRNPHFQ